MSKITQPVSADTGTPTKVIGDQSLSLDEAQRQMLTDLNIIVWLAVTPSVLELRLADHPVQLLIVGPISAYIKLKKSFYLVMLLTIISHVYIVKFEKNVHVNYPCKIVSL